MKKINMRKSEIENSCCVAKRRFAEQHRKSAFTLIELMVVLAIIAILSTLVISFAGKFLSKAKENNTRSTQKIVLNAIDRFYEDTKNYPGTVMSTYTWESTIAVLTDLRDDSQSPAARKIIAELPSDAINNQGNTDPLDDVLVDGFGQAMQYHREGSRFNTPVLRSPGRDNDFGEEDDNIRSDEDD